MGKPSQKIQPSPAGKPCRKTIRMMLLLALACLFTGTMVVAVSALTVYMRADVSTLSETGASPTVIYDRYGKPYEQLSNTREEYVGLSDISPYLQNAVVAIEDERFRHHHGIDLIGIGRAVVTNIVQGDIAQGGSTITQQLAKNKFLSAERTFQRKFVEAVIAVKIERHYSKDQILEQYLNTIYFGEGAWGVQNAARTYFGKTAKELTLSEAALLAGLPKAPSYYSPLNHPEEAKKRRNLVLQKMAELGMITEEERIEAQSQELRLSPNPEPEENVTSSYADYVIAEAIEQTGLSEREILSGGWHIYTHLDPKAQEAAEYVYARPEEFFPEDKGGLQSGIVLVDSRTGGIRALVGQLGKKVHYRGFNYATQAKRQPGSAIKPIVVYAPALMEGYRPTDMIRDVRTDFGDYVPQNFGGRFHGWVTMEEALIESYNVPAVALLREIGIDRGLDLARKAGLPVGNGDRTLAIALGGMETGVSPLQMAQAYTMFANEGIWSEAHAIREIYDHRQNKWYEARPVQKRLLPPEIAYEMTVMMEKVVTRGTGTRAKMNRPVAGKTGTTQLPDIPEFRNANGYVLEGTRDAWFVGYTPQWVGAVWLGYANTDQDHYLTTTGGRFPAEIFREVMRRALEGEPAIPFDPPPGYRYVRGEVRYINGQPPRVQQDAENGDEKEKTGQTDEETESRNPEDGEIEEEVENDQEGSGRDGKTSNEADSDARRNGDDESAETGENRRHSEDRTENPDDSGSEADPNGTGSASPNPEEEQDRENAVPSDAAEEDGTTGEHAGPEQDPDGPEIPLPDQETGNDTGETSISDSPDLDDNASDGVSSERGTLDGDETGGESEANGAGSHPDSPTG